MDDRLFASPGLFREKWFCVREQARKKPSVRPHQGHPGGQVGGCRGGLALVKSTESGKRSFIAGYWSCWIVRGVEKLYTASDVQNEW